jgi:hypothetical protein
MMGGHHRPGVTDTLLSVTFTKKEDIFLLHLSNYTPPLYNPVNPFGAISECISPMLTATSRFTPQLHKN